MAGARRKGGGKKGGEKGGEGRYIGKKGREGRRGERVRWRWEGRGEGGIEEEGRKKDK